MRRTLILSLVAGGLSLAAVPAAHALVPGAGCQPSAVNSPVVACSYGDDQSQSASVGTQGTDPGGQVVTSQTSDGTAAVSGDSSGSVSDGWIQVQVGPSGPLATCGSAGYPGSSSTCP